MSRTVDITSAGSPIRRRAIIGTDGTFTVESQQDVGEVLSFNKALHNAERSSSSLWGGSSWVRVASIPLILIEKWRKEGLRLEDKNARPKIMARLNSSEYAHLRTAPGVI